MTEPTPRPPEPAAAAEPEPQAAPAVPLESRAERLRRHGRRVRLYTWAALLVAALIVIVALIVSNTRQVKVSWVFGHSHTTLVWLVVIPAIVGWIGGIATAFLFRRRTRAPRP